MSTEFWIFILAVMVSIGLLFTMVWHVSIFTRNLDHVYHTRTFLNIHSS